MALSASQLSLAGNAAGEGKEGDWEAQEAPKGQTEGD